MKFIHHVIISIVFIPLYPILGKSVFLIMLASIIIDIDHVYILFKEKSFSIKRIKSLNKSIHAKYKKDPTNAFKDIIYIFHTVAFNILLLILSLWFPPLIFVSMGFIFHILTDIIHHLYNKMPVLRWLYFFEFIRQNLDSK